jgi:hypothetical protein
MFNPRSRPRRASSLKLMIFAIFGFSPMVQKWVG